MTKKNKTEKDKLITFRFGYKETIVDLTVCGAVFTVGLIISVVFRIWMVLGILALFAIILVIGLLADGALAPIYISDRHVGFRGKKMLWKDIKITLYMSSMSRGRYDLIIGTTYFRDKKKIKQQKKTLPCIYLKNAKILKSILPYYKAKLLVVNPDGVEIIPELTGQNKNINAVIIEHNSAYTK